MIGNVIKYNASISGAEVGCQGEVGSACSMAAAAANQLFGGTPQQIEYAAEIGLEHHLGLTCDPVCGLVEVPCIKRNPFLGVHAVTAYELASAGIQSLIPLDEIIDTLEQTGQLMSPSLKESSQAGLAKTKTGIKLEEKFFSKQ